MSSRGPCLLCNMMNILTSSGWINPVCHIIWQMRNSWLVACTDPRYASVGTLSHPVAFPLRRASSQQIVSSSAAKPLRFRSASAEGRWNFVPINLSHSPSSCAVVVIGRPSAPFEVLLQLVGTAVFTGE